MNEPRKLVYMMHPLGDGANRERNRKLACLWQAVVQEAHPEWLVLAPWIGLSGAWSEALRELGMQVDFATIDACAGGIVTGPLTGPVDVATESGVYLGVSPGMGEELRYFGKAHPEKFILDLRKDFEVGLPPNWMVPRVLKSANEFKPKFGKFQKVYVENKPGGVCHVKDVEEQSPGCFRYVIERTEVFFAHEQALADDNS